MRLWKEDPDAMTGLCGLFIPRCKHCGTVGEFFMAKIGKFSINDGTDEPESHHIDIELRCPECGYWWVYGVAVSREHYERVKEKEFENLWR